MEVRYGCMLFINVLKSVMDDDESWDAYGVMSSWNKFMLLSVVFFLLSFYSIQITSFSSKPLVEVRYQSFSVVILLSLLFSLILPQRACWPFFLLLWLSTYRSFAALIKALVRCFEAILSKIPGYSIGATSMHFDELDILELDLEIGGAPYSS